MTTLPQTTSIQLPRPAGPAPIATVSHGGPMAHAQAGQMTGSDVLRVLRSNMWILIAAVVVGLAIGFGLNAYLARFYPRYTATGYVQIQPGKRLALLGNDEQNLDANQSLVVEQRTQAQILMTDSLFSSVLGNANYDIRKTSWLQQFNRNGQIDVAAAKEDLSKKFSASPIGDSKLIAVSFTGPDARDCRTIVMDIVQQHLEDQRKISSDKLVEQVQLLNTLKSRYDSQIRNSKLETSREAATLQLDGFGRPGGVGQKEQELQILISQKLKAEDEANDAANSFAAAQQEVSQGGTPGYVEMMVSQNFNVMRLQQSLDDYDIQIRALRFQGPESRTAQQLEDYRSATKEKLDNIRAEQRVIQTDSYLSSLRGQADARRQSVEQINKQIDKIKNDLADMAARLSDYLTKKDEENALNELSRRMRDQLDKLNVMIQQVDMNSVAWMSKPETPDIPSFPKLPMTLAVSVAVALGLSLGFCFLREVMDTSVRSPRDIARVGQMSLLGMIPHEDDDPQTEGVPLATVIYGAPASMMAEQFRQVRTRLQHTASLDTTRSILVTSPGPGDGKSTIACNLAAGLALNGRRILLVDANFRRPELHKVFGLTNDAGFGNVLASVGNFESCVRQTKVPNLDLMTAGPKPANATELLESQLLIDFIERALEEYDHVIFDSGPMLVVSETVALAPRVDGVVTVVRASTNSRGLLQRMRDTLKQLKAEHLGVVLNGVRTTAGGYYGRNIKTYYEYQNSQPS